MDLPPDKAKLLKSYDDDKKWELICDQVCSLSAWLKLRAIDYWINYK